ncbi:DNA polymerase IV [Corynebacterium amycolatum]|uniref:DNA polymerase IV n=1 Tax=Corynebacterium TaxID=1716 RepID=UPI0008A55BAB|nr:MULTISPECIES: DNA polymerase IV [Corynebacterium]AYX82000.1 DNA polymerase IV [Corynebacterium jeikeium]KAA9227980.1 DNA polymerase IV [Corynebacterium amycolatum]MBC6797062.1 DNA polymerase IV [Corynebacterium sp. LK31]MCT1547218.1 DNA polymerase IV [Corynebacterium amycolatum]MDK8727374.1 DNA polymerase IV [Corynebacterium amycolatum]
MPTSGRWVLHIDMDAFFASVEQLTRPTLRGRPVLVGGLGGRGVVAGASYEARAYGAHSAMPMARARRLMPPTAVTVSARKGIYGPVSRRVFSVIRERVPVVEQLSVDEAFMEPEELQGASKEQVIAWAEQLRADIRRETGLASSIGAGAGKQFAKIASGLAKPDGVYVLDPARNHELLHPLPVEKLWGIGPVTAAKLHTLGVETIGDFAAMSQRDVEVSLTSKTGVMLWQLAQGTDDRPVKERDVAKSVSAEYTYPEDLESQAQLHAAVDRAGESAFRRLKKDGRGARTITCKVRLSDLSIHTRSETLAYATQDFDTLMAVAHRIAFTPAEVGPVRLVGVGFSGLDSHIQEVLFPELDRAITVEDRVPAPALSDAPAGLVELSGTGALPTVRLSDSKWAPTSDVHHSEYGHGWVQGSGHGIVTVRFESRTSGPGRMITLKEDDPELRPCSAVCSLDWPEWLASDEAAALDLPQPERESEDDLGPDADA